jgi:hypothetical protein
MRRPIAKPSYKNRDVSHSQLKQFRYQPWWLELNEWLKYMNQLRHDAGLPELLISFSQYQEWKKCKRVWVHRDDRTALVLFRDAKEIPIGVQYFSLSKAIDFPDLNVVISDEPNAPIFKSVWYNTDRGYAWE